MAVVVTPTVVTFQLTPSEMHIASIVGVQRALYAVGKNKRGRYGCRDGANFDLNVIGCAGEMTLARYLDCYWNGAFGDLTAADVSGNYQVRASAYDGPNAGLILHREDKDEQPFVKAIVHLPTVTLMGWLQGWEGKQDRYWTTSLQQERPAFLVPHHDLHDMQELRQELEFEYGKKS